MTTQTVPPEAQPMLEQVKNKYGFVPNVLKELSVSPAALQAYLQGQSAMENASLTKAEQGVIQFIISLENECHYCSAGHKAMLAMDGFSKDELEQVKKGGAFQDERLQAFAELTRLISEKRGWLEAEQLSAFSAKGITRQQLVEVITLIALKTMTNYVNHIAKTPIDEQFNG